MKTELQIDHLKKDVDKLQKIYGNSELNAIYRAGCIHNPKALFLFMNPTARNISAFPEWRGLRAPWISTKNIWKLLNSFELFDNIICKTIQEGSIDTWTIDFATKVYEDINKRSIYITNLAKCTQDDARKLKDQVFKEYLLNTLEEIYEINPGKIISFGNQVSSILLGRKIKMSDYAKKKKEKLTIKNKEFDVYPVYYPVGQGKRNIKKAVSRIKTINI